MRCASAATTSRTCCCSTSRSPTPPGSTCCGRFARPTGSSPASTPRLPVIVLTGRGADADRVRGLESGADDYLVKPFHYPELRARIGAVLRRVAATARRAAARRGDRRSTPPGARLGRRAGGRISPTRSSRCCALSPRTRCASSPSSELLRDVWGYRDPGADPHPRFACQPAAAQTRPRERPLRRQLLGRRIQAGRRVNDAEQIVVWLLVASMVAALTAQGLRAGRRRSALNEALHELRRPLQAIAAGRRPGVGEARRDRELGAAGSGGAGAARPRDQRRRPARVRSRGGPLPAAAARRGRSLAGAGERWGRLAGAALASRGGDRRRRPGRPGAGARQLDRQRDRARRPLDRRRSAAAGGSGCGSRWPIRDAPRARSPGATTPPTSSPGSRAGEGMGTASSSCVSVAGEHDGRFALRITRIRVACRARAAAGCRSGSTGPHEPARSRHSPSSFSPLEPPCWRAAIAERIRVAASPRLRPPAAGRRPRLRSPRRQADRAAGDRRGARCSPGAGALRPERGAGCAGGSIGPGSDAARCRPVPT